MFEVTPQMFADIGKLMRDAQKEYFRLAKIKNPTKEATEAKAKALLDAQHYEYAFDLHIMQHNQYIASQK